MRKNISTCGCSSDRRLRLVWTAVFAVTFSGAVALAQSPLPYTSGFEAGEGFRTGDLEGQGGWVVNQGTANVVDGKGRGESTGLSIAPSEPFGQVSLHLEKPEGNIVFSDFWIKPVATKEEEGSQFADVEGAITGFFKVAKGGELQVLDGGGDSATWKETGVVLEIQRPSGAVQKWVRITMRHDFANKVWDLYVDGNLKAESLKLWDPSATHLGRFSLMGYSHHPLVFDDLKIAAQSVSVNDKNRDGVPDELLEDVATAELEGRSIPQWLPGYQLMRAEQGIAGNGVPLAHLRWVVGESYRQFESELIGGAGFPLPEISESRAVANVAKVIEARAAARPFWDRLNAISPEYVRNLLQSRIPDWEYTVPWNPLEEDLDNGKTLNTAQLVSFFYFGLGNDQDGDGLTDLQEYQIGGDATTSTAEGDADGDGASNAAELAAGKDPTSRSSRPDGQKDAESIEVTEVHNRNDDFFGQRDRAKPSFAEQDLPLELKQLRKQLADEKRAARKAFRERMRAEKSKQRD